MSKAVVFLDTEYFGTKEKNLNVVCCSTTVTFEDGATEEKDWWTHNNPQECKALASYLWHHREKTFYSWSIEAEASAMISIGLDVLKFDFIDLFVDYKMLQNHNWDLLHGKQYIEGRVVKTQPYGQKGSPGLAGATYKLLGEIVDTAHKTAMRDLIISSPSEFTFEQRQAIMAYCRSDVKNLPRLRKAIAAYYPKLFPKKHLSTIRTEALERGKYAARTAMMVRTGYPVNAQWLRNFSANVPLIMETCQRDILRQFPSDKAPFRWNKARQRFSLNTKAVKDWIWEKHGTDWEETEGGDISLALDAFTKKYTFGHDYPDGNLAAQMIRYLKLKQATNGFNPNSEKTIFDYLGSDNRIRAYLNPYGAQSSRTQPGSTAFIFLKPAWVRTLVQPPQGKSIGDFDWSSCEFLLSGLLSGDKKMLEAYRSGDVYLAFGKMIKWIPESGTKKSHKYERDVCKQVVLALSYLMSKYGLAIALKEATGKYWDIDEAQGLIDQFDETFDVFAEWRMEQIALYGDNGYIRLKDGWIMGPDNENHRSVGNMPIQGASAVILRRAVAMAQDRGLTVLFSLHDAIYIEYVAGDYGAMDVLKECMVEAFVNYFDGEMREAARMIRVDPCTWGDEFGEDEICQDEDGKWVLTTGTMTTPKGLVCPASKTFHDERALREFVLYQNYMKDSSGEELL